jgi:hypothetical protein
MLHHLACAAAIAVVVVLSLAVTPALAGDPADENPIKNAQFSAQFGVFEPSGESDLWKLNEKFTTQDTSDLDNWIVGMSFGVPVARHFDMQFGIQYYRGDTDVRYRDIFTLSDGAVEQNHELWMLPQEITFRFLLVPRRSSDGHLYPVVPYLGGGVGGMLWEYREEGFFADDAENPTFVFYDEREQRGVTGTLHAVAGIEVQFSREAAMFFEGRYRWAHDDLGGDFDSGLDNFDLGGASLTAGFTWRFGHHSSSAPDYEEED